MYKKVLFKLKNDQWLNDQFPARTDTMYQPWFLCLQVLLWVPAHPSGLDHPADLGRPGTAQHSTEHHVLTALLYIHQVLDCILFWTYHVELPSTFSPDTPAMPRSPYKRHRLICTVCIIRLNSVTFAGTGNKRRDSVLTISPLGPLFPFSPLSP